MARGIALLALGFALALAVTSSAAAETLEVNKRGDHNDGFCTPADCTLREGVLTVAFSPEESGKVILPSRKPYRLTIPGEDEFGQMGDLDFYSGRLVIVHPGRGRATIDAGEVDRVLEVFARVTLKNLVITGGLTANYGGGIRAWQPLKLINTVVRGNEAAACGGGIHMQNTGAPLTLRRSSVIGNFGNQGGGISASCFGSTGPVKISNSTIARNEGDADGNLNGYGGGIYLQTSSGVQSVIQDSTFTRNSSGLGGIGQADGGGIYTDSGRLRILGSTISGNRSGDTGGGIHIDGTEPAEIINSTISRNRANANGGGIEMESEELSLNGVTVVRNRGNADGVFSEAGGGISNDDPDFTVRNSLIALNTLTALTPGTRRSRTTAPASIRSILWATTCSRPSSSATASTRRATSGRRTRSSARSQRTAARRRPSRSRPGARRSARLTSRPRPNATSAAASAIESPISARSSVRRFRPRAGAARARAARRSAPTTPPR